MKVVYKTWLSPGGTGHVVWSPSILDDLTIGIVVAEDLITGKQRAFIGVGRGRDEGVDAMMIMRHGSPLSKSMLEEILAAMKEVE